MFDNNIWWGKWKNEEATEWQRAALSKAPLWSKSVAGSVPGWGWRTHTNVREKQPQRSHMLTRDLNTAWLTHLSTDSWFIRSLKEVRPVKSPDWHVEAVGLLNKLLLPTLPLHMPLGLFERKRSKEEKKKRGSPSLYGCKDDNNIEFYIWSFLKRVWKHDMEVLTLITCSKICQAEAEQIGFTVRMSGIWSL